MKDINRMFTEIIRMLALENNSPRLVAVEEAEGLWEMQIRTTSLLYDVFYDAESGELPGISFEPATDTDAVYDAVFAALKKTA